MQIVYRAAYTRTDFLKIIFIEKNIFQNTILLWCHIKLMYAKTLENLLKTTNWNTILA